MLKYLAVFFLLWFSLLRSYIPLPAQCSAFHTEPINCHPWIFCSITFVSSHSVWQIFLSIYQSRWRLHFHSLMEVWSLHLCKDLRSVSLLSAIQSVFKVVKRAVIFHLATLGCGRNVIIMPHKRPINAENSTYDHHDGLELSWNYPLLPDWLRANYPGPICLWFSLRSCCALRIQPFPGVFIKAVFWVARRTMRQSGYSKSLYD